MIPDGSIGLFAGAITLGLVHGIEPGHGWPVAASYALDRDYKWLSGLAASTILGVGHLISSIAMVAVFFWAKSYFELTQLNDPIVLGEGIAIGGPMGLAAGVLLVALGIREYRHGHSHDAGIANGGTNPESEHHADSHDHHQQPHEHEHIDLAHPEHLLNEHEQYDQDHHHHGESHHDHDDGGVLSRIKTKLPFVGSGHDHPDPGDATDRGLLGIAGFAFLLGFAHEEEFEIIGLCLGSSHCLSLMLVYAVTVIVGIVGLTLLLIAGYERYEDRVEAYADALPLISAGVLTVMGIGFITGVF